jgi:hypothetical protein
MCGGVRRRIDVARFGLFLVGVLVGWLFWRRLKRRRGD